MVWGVSNHYIELHFSSKFLGYPGLNVAGVNERIRIVLDVSAPVEDHLWRAAVSALTAFPRVSDAFKPDVAIVVGKGACD